MKQDGSSQIRGRSKEPHNIPLPFCLRSVGRGVKATFNRSDSYSTLAILLWAYSQESL